MLPRWLRLYSLSKHTASHTHSTAEQYATTRLKWLLGVPISCPISISNFPFVCVYVATSSHHDTTTTHTHYRHSVMSWQKQQQGVELYSVRDHRHRRLMDTNARVLFLVSRLWRLSDSSLSLCPPSVRLLLKPINRSFFLSLANKKETLKNNNYYCSVRCYFITPYSTRWPLHNFFFHTQKIHQDTNQQKEKKIQRKVSPRKKEDL